MLKAKQPTTLGRFAFVVRPEVLRATGASSKTIPISLICGLCEGKVGSAEEYTVVSASGDSLSYSVNGYGDTVVLPLKMVDELKRWSGKGGFQGLITHFKEEGAVDELLVSLILQRIQVSPIDRF